MSGEKGPRPPTRRDQDRAKERAGAGAFSGLPSPPGVGLMAARNRCAILGWGKTSVSLPGALSLSPGHGRGPQAPFFFDRFLGEATTRDAPVSPPCREGHLVVYREQNPQNVWEHSRRGVQLYSRGWGPRRRAFVP